MPDDLHPDSGDPSRAARTLARIADALGKPPGAILGGTDAADGLAGATELLRLWLGLASETDRRKVLAFVRAVAMARADHIAGG